jgi:hypothetical protein
VHLHLGDSVREEQISGSRLNAGRVWKREFVAHADTSERELRDGFFDINNLASQVRFYVRILDVSILAFMAPFALWISFALGKYLNGLRYQPQDMAVIRFDFKFHVIHTPSAQADISPMFCLFKPGHSFRCEMLATRKSIPDAGGSQPFIRVVWGRYPSAVPERIEC